MANKSKISWVNFTREDGVEVKGGTWNFLVGCSMKSKGCLNCYAIRDAWRLAHNTNPKISSVYEDVVEEKANGMLNWTGVVKLVRDRLGKGAHWKTPRLIFVNSMSDLHHESLDLLDIDLGYAAMCLCPWHKLQTLTKRADLQRSYINDPHTPKRVYEAMLELTVELKLEKHKDVKKALDNFEWPAKHIWTGISIESQEVEDKEHRADDLRATMAHLRWISYEPGIGPVDWKRVLPGMDWLVSGGESGPKVTVEPRPHHPLWSREALYAAQQADVPFHFKQWGDYGPVPEEQMMVQRAGDPERFWIGYENGEAYPAVYQKGELVAADDYIPSGFALMNYHPGKKKLNGRKLDNVVYDDFPRDLPGTVVMEPVPDRTLFDIFRKE